MSHLPYYGQIETKPATSNGYDIRAQVIAMAKDYVENQARITSTYANKMLELNKITTEQYLELIKPYTLKDIMSHATDMYKFISIKK